MKLLLVLVEVLWITVFSHKANFFVVKIHLSQQIVNISHYFCKNHLFVQRYVLILRYLGWDWCLCSYLFVRWLQYFPWSIGFDWSRQRDMLGTCAYAIAYLWTLSRNWDCRLLIFYATFYFSSFVVSSSRHSFLITRLNQVWIVV